MERKCPQCGTEAYDGAKFCHRCGSRVLPVQNDGYAPGEVIDGKFRIEKLLGTGAMGKVLLATQLSLDKPVCIKVLHPQLTTDPEMVKRFLREVHAASRLAHPNCITIIDFGTDRAGRPYLAMEYLPGKNLAELLQQEFPLSERRILSISEQIASALAHAHDQGIVHRDIKPENVLVARAQGVGDFVKVLDFGLAKMMTDSALSRLTKLGTVCGTPEYMSPEQAQGHELDGRSDLYSLGVLMYQMATGRLPFVAESAVALLSKHLTENPVPPRTIRPESISAGLEAVILKLLEKNPANRFQSALDLQAELQRLVLGLRDDGAKAAAPVAPPSIPTTRSPANQTQDVTLRDVTVLFSDMVGMTDYFDRYGDVAGHEKIMLHNKLLIPLVEQNRGTVVKTVGDAIMAKFDAADDAVAAAIAMQRKLEEFNQKAGNPDRQIRIRIGIHSGKSIMEDHDVFGNTVNVAARIASKAAGEEILISSATRELLLRQREATRFHSLTRVKGKQDILNLYGVTWREEEAEPHNEQESEPETVLQARDEAIQHRNLSPGPSDDNAKAPRGYDDEGDTILVSRNPAVSDDSAPEAQRQETVHPGFDPLDDEGDTILVSRNPAVSDDSAPEAQRQETVHPGFEPLDDEGDTILVSRNPNPATRRAPVSDAQGDRPVLPSSGTPDDEGDTMVVVPGRSGQEPEALPDGEDTIFEPKPTGKK